MNGDDDPAITPVELDEAHRYSLIVAWSPRDEAYLVAVPELPGCRTHSATHAEAVALGEEAVATCLAGLRAGGQPVPPPRFATAPV